MALAKETTWEERFYALKNLGRLPPFSIWTGEDKALKSSYALYLAQLLFCPQKSPPCKVCASCKRVESSNAEGLLWIKPTGLQIKIQQARDIIKFTELKSHGPRLVVVEDAHLLNPQAANALLKVLEEPSPQIYFVFLAPTRQSLLATLRSRAQWFSFASSLSSEQILSSLEEGELNAILKFALELRDGTGRPNLHELTGSSEFSLRVIQILQFLFRDAAFSAVGGKTLRLKNLKETSETLSSLGFSCACEIFELTQQMEKDILGHVDRQLVFENFCIEARKVSEGRSLSQ